MLLRVIYRLKPKKIVLNQKCYDIKLFDIQFLREYQFSKKKKKNNKTFIFFNLKIKRLAWPIFRLK